MGHKAKITVLHAPNIKLGIIIDWPKLDGLLSNLTDALFNFIFKYAFQNIMQNCLPRACF